MSKPNRKNNETYSHPLIKDVYQLSQQTHSTIVPSYCPIRPDHTNRISSKIIRSAILPKNNVQSQILMSVNLFGNAVQSLTLIEQPQQCKHCRTKINPRCEVLNNYEFVCNLCDKLTRIQSPASFELLHLKGYRVGIASFVEGSQEKTKINSELGKLRRRRILFVIQASQYNYEANVHSSIFSCLKAIDLNLVQIGFILFNDKHVMFLQPSNLELTKVTLTNNESFNDWKSIPIDQNQLFTEANSSIQELQQLVATIMYEAFFIKHSLIGEVSKMLNLFISKQTEVKCFISFINHSQKQPTSEMSQTAFKEKQNTFRQNIAKKLPFLYQAQANQITKTITNNASLNFFVISPSTNYKKIVQECQYNLVKIYKPKNGQSLQNQLYYDLFQNITQNRQFQVQILFKTSKEIKLSQGECLTGSLFGRAAVQRDQRDAKMNCYTLVVKQADCSLCLPLSFTYHPNTQNQQKAFIQISYELVKDNKTRQTRQLIVMNIMPSTDLTQDWLQNVDDELVFNHHLRKCFSAWDQQNFKLLKSSLFSQYLSVVRLFIDRNGSNIIFPKNWKHYLLYSHLLQQKHQNGTLNFYEIFKILNKNIESFSKYLYYRAYKLQDEVVKNIKFTEGIFQKYQIIFLQNGENAYLVMKEPPVQIVKDIFGYYDDTTSLANQHPQLPVLESNAKYRAALQTIRSLHQDNFLPLKILDYEGLSFERLVKQNLYQKEKHLSFLRRAWQQA